MTKAKIRIGARSFGLWPSGFVIRERIAHGFDLLDRTFAREDGEIAPKLAGELHAGRAGDGHLRRRMDREIGRETPDEPADADVLDDGGIDSGRDDRAEIFFGVGQFVGEDEGVEGDIAADAAPMEERHQLRQIGFGEVLRPHPGVEPVEAEVDRVGPVLDGRADAFPIAGGREQLRQRECGSDGLGNWKNGGVGHNVATSYQVPPTAPASVCEERVFMLVRKAERASPSRRDHLVVHHHRGTLRGEEGLPDHPGRHRPPPQEPHGQAKSRVFPSFQLTPYTFSYSGNGAVPGEPV